MTEDEKTKRAHEKVEELKKEALEKVEKNKGAKDKLLAELQELGIDAEKKEEDK